ncbi:Uncharacterised protein [Mycobacteroides abscessus subsp. abscessus]|nr:Uncharacterised protein [Mycobacteroides abscessus subsp. abscessus]SIN39721.1 Uncharacterised protein [Mycobacteroides abscessus subsp. abscessus]SKW42237.1 Uncharacterised protein [Mycobacteroides abscessus subsp. abscessus]SKZ12006.1 Uncharacterised protein [Mycobacteroides abscessus subsp. abscessus]
MMRQRSGAIPVLPATIRMSPPSRFTDSAPSGGEIRQVSPTLVLLTMSPLTSPPGTALT